MSFLPDDFIIIDKLASSYGWSIEYIQKLDVGEISKLFTQIEKRETEHYRMLSYLTTLAVGGKTIDTALNQTSEPTKKLTATEEKELVEARTKRQEKEMAKLFKTIGMTNKKLQDGLKKGKLEI